MIRVFVGTSANGEDAESCAVLEWSIRKHASEPVEITWMRLSRDPNSIWGGWDTSRWATPFSAFRWAIPEACGFQGQAIYCDSDVIFTADIAELWRQSFEPGKVVMGKGAGSWRLCVSLWDCSEAQRHVLPLWQLKSDPGSHRTMTTKIVPYVQAFEGDWNCLDGSGYETVYNKNIKALHYTDMSCQPHLKYALPRLAARGQRHWFDGQARAHPRDDVQRLFDWMLQEATLNGYTPESYVPNDLFGSYTKQALTSYRGNSHALQGREGVL